MATKPKIEKLVEEVVRYGDYDERGQAALDRLSQIGEAAIPVFVQRLKKPLESDLHGRDVHDSMSAM